MVSIKKYKHNKSGKEFYSFQAHIGVGLILEKM